MFSFILLSAYPSQSYTTDCSHGRTAGILDKKNAYLALFT